MFDSVKDEAAKRIIARAEAALASTVVEIVEQSADDVSLLIDSVHEVWITNDNWDCNCSSPMNPCLHVITGILALERGTVTLQVQTVNPGFLRYKISEGTRGIEFSRVWVENNRESRYRGQGELSELDKSIQRLFDEELRAGNIVAKERIHDLLSILENDDITSITFNGHPYRTSSKLAGPVAVIEHHPEGYLLRLAGDPKMQQVFKGGIVLYDGELRKFDRVLDNLSYTHLQRGIKYRIDEVEPLVCEAIPNLKRQIPVYSLVDDLPTAVEAAPYILIETKAKTGTGSSIQSIEVIAQIVYGRPPIAKVVNQSLERLNSTIPMRQIAEEDRLIGMYRLLKSSRHFPLNFAKEFTVDQIPQVLSTLNTLKSIEGITISGFATTIQVKKEIQPTIDVSENDLSVDWEGAESNAVFEAWRNQQQYILLDNGSLHQLPNDWLAENGHLVRELLLAKEQAGNRLPSFALFDLAQLCAKLNQPPPANLEHLRVLTGDFDGIPASELPEGLNATLRDYQREGYNWLSFLKNTRIGGILADDMGLGKTLQALCVLEHQSLVVAPTSVLHNWVSETNKFRDTLSISLYHGTGRIFNKNANIILTSYAILRNDIEKLEKVQWKVVVLDEAQAIKNPKSLTAQSAFRLQSDFRLTLTGTPIENRLTELWSQIHFLCPGLLGGYSDFIRQYEQPITEGQMNVALRLRNKIKPFVLRRLKKDVAPELPPRSNQILYCTLSETERNTYDAVRVATQQSIVKQLEEGTLNVMNALEALLRLRQAACHSGLLPGVTAETSSKVETLVDKLEEVTNSGHKALVFSQWTSLLNLIEPLLMQKNIGFVRLDGSTKDRQGVVETFQTDDNIPIFLSSLKAGGTGLNLTEADHVFLVDPWWNPAVEDQAADRAHRIGQTKSVIVYKMVTKDTVEERILVLQDRKRQLAETALGGASQGASITKEDLLELLQ